ncbi:hypothetical protein [Natronorubrum sp. A-ect3]|uniref:hypothetical protein n=1 Tax=Natronorubrum sp. A-ect3 TaxID=3242698 RepID=UPI00359CBFB2
MLIYNGWVMLNTVVADQSPDRDDDEIVIKQNSYPDDLDQRVLGSLDVDLLFPDVGHGQHRVASFWVAQLSTGSAVLRFRCF